MRHVRYVPLNPPRARLVDDPLEWLFSTHRDVVGATVDPWIDARRLSAALARPRQGFVPWYHRYVSADPAVDVAGTPVPRPAEPSDIPSFSLATVARAVAAATRSRPDAIRRTGLDRSLFIALARAHGWRDTSMLANACACGPRAIQRAALHDIDLTAAALCLGDTRLLDAAPRWRR